MYEGLPIFTVDQPAYLLNNWRILQAQSVDAYGKYVICRNGVITITSGSCLVRFDAGVPDGYYIIDSSGRFVGVSPQAENAYTVSIPDVEVAKPISENLTRVGPISRNEVSVFIEFLNYTRQSDNLVGNRAYTLLSGNIAKKTEMYLSCREENTPEFAFSVPLPMREGGIYDTTILKLAFTEMLRYDEVYMFYDNTTDRRTPLIIGHTWKNCALVMSSR
jgi:PAS domain-containing protein